MAVPGENVKAFYRRPLPDTCIDFASSEGRRLFASALESGHMECYFNLAAQFRTQDELAFCGLSTLVMVLNSLAIDPGQIWKGPWRWYHENMLNCCVKTDIAKQNGITLAQFTCVALCNYLRPTTIRADSSAKEDDFREAVISCATSRTAVMAVSYSRAGLGQSGDGHFSPIGGYDPNSDRLLIMDTARFKYPPHWVLVTDLFNAMKAVDQTTGKPRGYVTLTRQENLFQLILFSISDTLRLTSNFSPTVQAFLLAWSAWLQRPHESLDLNTVTRHYVLETAVRNLLQFLSGLTESEGLFTIRVDLKCSTGISDQHNCSNVQLINDIEHTAIHQDIADIFKLSQEEPRTVQESRLRLGVIDRKTFVTHCMNERPFNCQLSDSCDEKLSVSHFLSVFLLSWPYDHHMKESSNGQLLAKYVNECMHMIGTGSSDVLRNEISCLHSQMRTIIDVAEAAQDGSVDQVACCRR